MKEIVLHERQLQAVTSTKRVIIMCSGIQGGKTFSGALWLRKIVSENPGADKNFIVTAPTVKIFHQATEPAFLNMFRGLGNYNKTRAEFDMGDGRKIFLRTMHIPDAIEGITNVFGIWADEGGMYSSKAWINIEGRSAVKEAPIYVTTTPYALNWLYKDIYKPWTKGKRPDVEFVQFESVENPYFPRREFERQKALLDPRVFKMKYCGMFEKMAGLVFLEFDDVLNMYEQFEPDREVYHICAGVDWGYTNAFAISIRAVNRQEERDYQIGEFYQSFLTPSEKVGVAKQLKARYGIETFYCDNEAPDMIKEFNDAGLTAMAAPKYPGSLVDNIARHNEIIKTRVHKVMHGRCRHTLDEYATYHYPEVDDKIEKNTPEAPIDANNHIMTANMYATQCTEYIRADARAYRAPVKGKTHLEKLLDGEYATATEDGEWYDN